MKISELAVGKKIKCKVGRGAEWTLTVGDFKTEPDGVHIYSENMKIVVTGFVQGDELTNIEECGVSDA